MKLSNKWTNDAESYLYHMVCKTGIVSAMYGLVNKQAGWFNVLSTIVVKSEWIEPEIGDLPNYEFWYNLGTMYLEYCKTVTVPLPERLVYENVVKYAISLVKQDKAYNSRFNGVVYKLIHDLNDPELEGMAFLELFGKMIIFWRVFEGREYRNFELFNNVLNHIYKKCEFHIFYGQSLSFFMNYVIDHKSEFEYFDSFNPKNWYANCGVGMVDVITTGGTS